MTAFYSPSEQGFFDTAFHSKKQIPADSIVITEPQRKELIAGMSQGHLVQVDSAGVLALVAPPADPSAPARIERAWRDGVLASMVWLRDRHRDQLEIGSSTSLTVEQFTELLAFMQALRDWPQSSAFPDVSQRPESPVWLADQTQ